MGNCCTSNGWTEIKNGCAQCLCCRHKRFNQNALSRSFGSNKENITALGHSAAIDEVDGEYLLLSYSILIHTCSRSVNQLDCMAS